MKVDKTLMEAVLKKQVENKPCLRTQKRCYLRHVDKCCESNEHAEITRLTLRAAEKSNDTYCAWYVSLCKY